MGIYAFENEMKRRQTAEANAILKKQEKDKAAGKITVESKKTEHGGHYRFTQIQIDEIRILRQRDPETWTYAKLCAKYNTTKGNISKIINRKNRQRRIDINSGDVSLFEQSHPSKDGFI